MNFEGNLLWGIMGFSAEGLDLSFGELSVGGLLCLSGDDGAESALPALSTSFFCPCFKRKAKVRYVGSNFGAEYHLSTMKSQSR